MKYVKKLCQTIPFITKQNYSTAVGNAVKTSTIGKVTCFGLNRPESRNSLSIEILADLKAALHDFENDSSSSAAVLYGERGNFSNGFDQNELNHRLRDLQEMINDITRNFIKKPLIAAVSGFAVGPGFDLALWCDFRIVEDTALLGAYARTYGVPLSDETAERLCHLVGVYRALDWVLTGRMITAKEALDVGVATRVVACGTALGQAVNFANSLINMPQACLKADRATLLSISDKFSSSDAKKIILKEKERNMKIALEEVKQGTHLTVSGDVRRKETI